MDNTFKISEILSEKEGVLEIGQLDSSIKINDYSSIEIDLSETIWGDPNPLLMLGCIIGNYSSKIDFLINLGSSYNQKHSIFLKFLSSQKFLRSYSKYSRVQVKIREKTNGKYIEYLENDWDKVIEKCQNIPHSMHMNSTLCIGASVLKITDLIDTEAVEELVESYVNEARTKTLLISEFSNKSSKERLLQKIRKIINELFSNSKEHGYKKDLDGYCGVYARIRHARTKLEKIQKQWDLIRKKEIKYSPTLDHFILAPRFEWLELFVTDIGDGLLYYKDDWELEKSKKDKLEKSKDPLKVLAEILFRNGISRFSLEDRLSSSRSIVTGLQHIDMMLSIDGDYSRIYTAGEWIGEMHPWDQGKKIKDKTIGKSLPGHHSTRFQKGKKRYAPGTSFAFCVQIKPDLIELPDSWVKPNIEQRKEILSSLCVGQINNNQIKWKIHDLLFDSNCLPPGLNEIQPDSVENKDNGILILRPPRKVSKKHLTKWLNNFAGNTFQEASWKCENLIIAEISPFQSILLEETIKKYKVFRNKITRIFLITKTWSLTCYKSAYGSDSYKIDFSSVDSFLSRSEGNKYSGAAMLASKLRECDSEIFWNDINDPVFHNGPVCWEASGSKLELKLDGYLSLKNAISLPSRRYIYLTAIQRCLELLDNYRIIPTDTLIDSLADELKEKGFHDEKLSTNNEKVLLGSVIVTAETIKDHWSQKDNISNYAISGFIHKSSPKLLSGKEIKEGKSIIPALNWIPQKGKKIAETYKRIKGTPYIARYGDKSVSIALYGRTEAGDVDFKKSYYGRTKKQTYRDFEILNCLKLNHHRNGNRHDFISLNTVLAFETSALEYGSLMEWLKKQFDSFFNDQNNLSLLIYPSHFATDRIIQTLSSHKYFSDIFSKIHIIPITFFDNSSAVPLRVSPTSEQELNKIIDNYKTSSSKKQCVKAMIFDDGVISGKHIRETKDFLLSINIDNIVTLALVDRTGMPLYEESLKIFSDNNKRYWRLDIPHVGSNTSCILCEAINKAKYFSLKQLSSSITERINNWVNIWQIKDMYGEWGHGGSNPIPLPDGDKYRKVTLGIYVKNDSEPPARNEFYVHNSTSIATYTAELTRLTTRVDKTYSRAKALLKEEPLISIEILSAQYFLFFDKLSYWEKFHRIKLLIHSLTLIKDDHNLTALPGLCLAILDENISAHIWEMFIYPEIISKLEIQSQDLAIAIGILARNIEESSYKNIIYENNTPSPIQRRNFLRCAITQNHLECYSVFFECIGIRSEKGHSNKLNRAIIDIVDNNKFLRDDCKYIIDSLRAKLAVSIKNFSKTMLYLDEYGIDCNRDAALLEEYAINIENAMNSEQDKRFGLVKKYCEQIRAYLYADTSSLSYKYRITFVKRVSKGDFIHDFLSKEISITRDATLEKIQTYPLHHKTRKKFTNSDGRLFAPVILCEKSYHEWTRDFMVYFDPLIISFLKEILSNSMHADSKIKLNNKSDRTAHMWWDISFNEDSVKLKFRNKSDHKDFNLKLSPGKRGLERVGGTYSQQLNERNEVESIVIIPLAEYLIEGKRDGYECSCN